MSEPLVLLETHDRVATLTLNRPASYNALNVELLEALTTALRRALDDEDVHGVVLTGQGKAFSAGGDVKGMQAALSDDPRGYVLSLTKRLHPLILSIRGSPKPVVAAVNGPVAGGGYGLCLACDARVAAPNATFKAAYSRLGIVPDGGLTYLLPRIVGWSVANRWILEDAVVGADEAMAHGMVDQVVPEHDLGPVARARAADYARAPMESFAETKRLLNESLLKGFKEHLDLERAANADSAGRPDFREGVAAFLEKRPPEFRTKA